MSEQTAETRQQVLVLAHFFLYGFFDLFICLIACDDNHVPEYFQVLF